MAGCVRYGIDYPSLCWNTMLLRLRIGPGRLESVAVDRLSLPASSADDAL
jgi:hypothetical protein